MAKCPNCGTELERYDDKKFYCPNCNKYYATKKQSTAQPAAQQQTEAATLQSTTAKQTETTQDVNSELEALKARLAALEAEKQAAKSVPSISAKEKFSNTLTKVATSKFGVWVKKHWIILIASALALIIFITLMTTLVGIRGVYVNVDDPNDFYSFTATGYTGYSEEFGKTFTEKGTWKTSNGKITFTVKDEDFGKFSADFQYSVKDGYKTLFIGEVGDDKENMKQYKRVSLVKYDINSKKANVTFDLNGGSGKIDNQKIKIGEKIKEPSEKPVRPEREFRGWYTEPYGYKNGGTRLDEDSRIWEDVTYYANWYNPTPYTVTVLPFSPSDEPSELIAYEGDNLFTLMQNIDANDGYTYDYTFDDVLINTDTYMPDKDITIYRSNKRTKQFTAHFDSNGGDFNIQQIDYSFGSTFSIPSEIPQKQDYFFIGWKFNGQLYFPDDCITADLQNLVFVAEYLSKQTYDDIISLCNFSIENNNAILTSVKDTTKSTYIIPSYYNGYKVNSIGNDVFRGCANMTAIIIPDTIANIGNGAFSSCSSLTSINIPDSVTSIGNGAFYGCSSLASITIPDSVTNIGANAFDNTVWYDSKNDGLVYIGKVAYKYKGTVSFGTITLKDGTKSIAANAFYQCFSLDNITIPNSVTNIGEMAFYQCSNLKSIDIPNSVISIGNGAFYGCSGLTSILVSNGNPKYYSVGNCLIETETKTLIVGCNNSILSSDNSLINIGDWAFYYCRKLTSITIPNSVTSIGSYAFSSCSSLTSINIPDRVTSIGSSAFSGCSSLTSINIPNGVTSVDDWTFSYCSSLISISIPDGVTSIGYHAFDHCEHLTNITIPDTVTSIGYFAFDGCTELTSINIPDNMTKIDEGAFRSCSGLTSVNIGNSVTTIGSGAFLGCSGLTNITLPNSVTTIGSGAFFDCSRLTNITIGNSVTSICDYAFQDCNKLTSITFNGTKAQWKAIDKGTDWNKNTGNFIIHCTDGDLGKYGNEI